MIYPGTLISQAKQLHPIRTIHIDQSPLPGAVEALKKLRSNSSIKIKFVSNTTKTSRKRLVQQLNEIGFDIALDDVMTSLTAAKLYVDQKKLKPMLFLEDGAKEEFENKDFSVSEANAVVIGLSPTNFNYEKVTRLLLKNLFLQVE